MGRGKQPATKVEVIAPTRRQARTPIALSTQEELQLITPRLRKDGTPSAHPYPTPELWPRLRQYLVSRSKKSNPNLDETLTAYTPGETLKLLDHPAISSWHQKCTAPVGDEYDMIVLVPCAKTKPWVGDAVKKSKLYSAYNALRKEMPNACFVTISEPLGIVTMKDWADFPQYDNPGLFRDDAQRSGMTKEQWAQSPFRRTYGVPFDEEARAQCIERLGNVVGEFLGNNQDKRIISVVDNATGPSSTHGEMLDVALAGKNIKVARHPKRLEPRVSPLDYLRGVLS